MINKTNKRKDISEKYPSLKDFKKYCDFKDTEELVTQIFTLWDISYSNNIDPSEFKGLNIAIEEKYPFKNFIAEMDSFIFPYNNLNDCKIDRPMLFDFLLYALTDITCKSKHTIKEYAYYIYNSIMESVAFAWDLEVEESCFDHDNMIIHITPKLFTISFRDQFPYIMIDEIRAKIDNEIEKGKNDEQV